MNKILLLLFVSVLFLSGCNGENVSSNPVASVPEKEVLVMPTNVLEITAGIFYEQIMDMQLNGPQYLDRGIRMRGMYNYWGYEGEERHYIYRWSWADCLCCEDAEIYLEFTLDPEIKISRGDWIEIEGVWKEFLDKDGYKNYHIETVNITMLDEPGMKIIYKDYRVEYDDYVIYDYGMATY